MIIDAGKIRRSQIITNYGPGSVVDFRIKNASVSAVVAGLEEWNNFIKDGQNDDEVFTIHETRLELVLRVKGFRAPPVLDDQDRGAKLIAYQFPRWLQCPRCNRIALAKDWSSDPPRVPHYCSHCSRDSSRADDRVFVIPVRFVMACEAGHLYDFPWDWWVGHTEDCKVKDLFNSKRRRRYEQLLILEYEHPGLSGLILKCPICNQKRSMERIFTKQTWRNFTCKGIRPWLRDNEDCEKQPRVVQRGASNLYFPVMESALSIPPWSDRVQEILGRYWHKIFSCNPSQRLDFINFFKDELEPKLKELNLNPEELINYINKRADHYNRYIAKPIHLREEEYQQFISGVDFNDERDREFEMRVEKVPGVLAPYISQIVRVVRLREVIALEGFTRINPPDRESKSNISPISTKKIDWLPAIEVRGEGIFIGLNIEKLRKWERNETFISRVRKQNERLSEEWSRRYTDSIQPRVLTPRFFLIHTFAHALMKGLTMECGYSSSSLKERIYVSGDEGEMAGLLIYTASSDSDGTLGGLQRQGQAGKITPTIINAIREMEWCSSDPLCIYGMIAAPDHYSPSACHACCLVPETSCEEYNRFLDRGTLIGLPDSPESGYFSALLRR